MFENRAAFHVACPHSGLHVCKCVLGTPVGLRSHSSANPRQLWEMWERQDEFLDSNRPRTAQVEVPKLIRRTMPYRDIDDGAEQLAKKEGEKALQKALKAAEAAVRAAAKHHAQAGLDFQPPPDLEVDLTNVHKEVDLKRVEGELAATRAKYESALKAALDAEAPAPPPRRERPAQQDHPTPTPQVPPAKRRRTQKATPARPILIRKGSTDSFEGPLFSRAQAGGAAPPPPSSSKTVTNDDSSICTSPRAASSLPVASRQATSRPLPGPGPTHAANNKTTVRPPDKKIYLTARDITPSLKDRHLQVFWPSDESWWQVSVTNVNVRTKKATLLYSTGDEEQVSLQDLIDKKEVAFVDEVTISDDSDDSAGPAPAPPVYSRPSQGGLSPGTKIAHPHSAPSRGTPRMGPGLGMLKSVSNYRKETEQAVEYLLEQGRFAESMYVKYMPQGEYKWKDGRVAGINQQKKSVKIILDNTDVVVLSHAKAGLEYALEVVPSP